MNPKTPDYSPRSEFLAGTAKKLGDVERAERAEREIDALTRELSRAVGLGGRNRRAMPLALPRLISTARSSAGCSIARSPGRPHRNIFPQITIHCFVSSDGSRTFGYLKFTRLKAIPCTPRSHALVERLIGTLRREYLDRTLFWNRSDLERKLDDYKTCYNQYRCHSGLAGATPAQRRGAPPHPIAKVESYSWQRHCHGLFETPTAA